MASYVVFKVILLAYLSRGLHSNELISTPVDTPSPSDCTGELYADLPVDESAPQIIIPAFFPFSVGDGAEVGFETPEGELHYVLPAALLAVDEINNDEGLLSGFHLVLDIRDSACDIYTGLQELIRSFKDAVMDPEGTPRLAVLGGGCSEVSEGLSYLTQRFNLPQVSYGYNPSKVPFFQAVKSLAQITKTALAVLDHFSWTHNIAVVYQDEAIYTTIIEEMVQGTLGGNFTFSNNDPDVAVAINVVELHESSSTQDLRNFLSRVRGEDLRVIMGLVTESYAYSLLCEASSGQIPGSGFVWVFVGTFSENWWKRNTTCPLSDRPLTERDVESALIVSSQVLNPNTSTIFDTSKKNLTQFKNEYAGRLTQWCPNANAEPLAATTYDAVWAIALAINSSTDLISYDNSLPGKKYEYNISEVFSHINSVLSETDFVGASGRLMFNDVLGRVGIDTIFQMQNGIPRPVGLYDGTVDFNLDDYSVRWPDGNQIPRDEPENINESIPLWFILPGVAVTILGVLFSIAMFIFNYVYRDHRILLAASQKLNYIIIMGAWLGYASVLILSILESDIGQDLSYTMFSSFCVIRLSALSMSFTLVYGTMFARAWRIYRIFNDPWVAKRPLRDYHLMLMVGFLLIGDLLILVPWTAIDHYRRFPQTSEVDYEQYAQCTYVSCSSTYVLIWLGATSLYKILLMLCGVFVVSLVRKGVVERKIFDDSKSLSIALYITAICFSVGLPLQLLFVMQFEITYAYVASAVWVNISAQSTIICVFVPKFYAIVIKKETGRTLQSVKSVFYVAHPELRSRVSPETEYTTDYYRSNEPSIFRSDSLATAVDKVTSESSSVQALPNCVAKAVSFDDSVDYIA